MAADYYVRPMRDADVEDADALASLACQDESDPSARSAVPPRASTSTHRGATLRHLLRHDPEACWVAESTDGLIGFAVGLRRELMWILAALVVRPGLRGRGVGEQLLDACLSSGRGCLRGMLAASSDPRAVRRYRLAGFTLHPLMRLRGAVPRSVLPVVDRVREGGIGDLDLLDSVDRRARGAAHGPDHTLLMGTAPLLVVERSTGSGYAYVHADGGPLLLAASNRRTATDLLWAALAAGSPDRPCVVDHVTAANEWAVDVGVAAGMEVHTAGCLALRHMKPPMPYLPHDWLL